VRSYVIFCHHQDKDVTLPGWGTWGGTGIKNSKPKKRIIIKAPDVGPRRDGKLNKVIINERCVRNYSRVSLRVLEALPSPNLRRILTFRPHISFACTSARTKSC
jgi:U3 small nucleolar RNA-associated protein 14